MQGVEIVAQLTDHAGDQVHHVRVTVNFGEIGDVAAAGGANACQIITGEIHQHQMFRKLFMIGTHFQFDAAVEVSVQRTIGTTTAWTCSGNRVDLNLAAGGVILERAFRRRAKQGEIIILHKKHVRAGITLFQHVIGRQR